MKTEWKGSYLDGKTAARRPATIRLMQTGLEVTPENGAAFLWPYDEIRQTQGSYAGEQVRLERGGPIPEALVVPEASFLSDLHRRVPGLAMRFHNPARRGIAADADGEITTRHLVSLQNNQLWL